jgi:uncharacterized damage-inducible protein DinB
MAPVTNDPGALLLQEIQGAFRRQKAQVERALAQLPPERWSTRLDDGDGNSISVLLRHVAGNLRSRWSEIFTTDGEKPDRDRDGEFEDADATPEGLMAAWEAGWAVALGTIDALRPDDLERVITIRGEPHSVARALVRSLDHTGHHTGQIVMLAKHLCGPAWATLSLPRRRVP